MLHEKEEVGNQSAQRETRGAGLSESLTPRWGLSSPGLQNLICPECGDEFVLQSQLSLHLEEHRKELSGIRVYTCKTCEKEFKTAAHLKEHMKSHAKMRLVGATTG